MYKPHPYNNIHYTLTKYISSIKNKKWGDMKIKAIRHTTNNKIAGGVRLMLAVVFLMTGPMKLLVPQLSDAWSCNC